MTTFRTRVRELRFVPAQKLLANPQNWRLHPDVQKEVMRGILEDVGVVDAVIAYELPAPEGAPEGYERQLMLIDGHLRTSLMSPTEKVPTLVVDLSEEEARKVLVTLDPIGQFAEQDDAKLSDLIKLVDTNNDAVRALLDELNPGDLDEVFDEDDVAAEEEPEESVDEEKVPDAIFPTDNEWGVPVLDLSMQVETLVAPCRLWGDAARTATMKGTYLFYIDDYKFNAIWDNPQKVVDSQCEACAEVNFSVNDNMARALVLYLTYRKRWLARFWQGKGVRILADLCVTDEHLDISMLGIPQGWRAYCTRGYTPWLDGISFQHEKACERAGTEKILFVVYGGGKAVRERCQERGWIFVPEKMQQHSGRAAVGSF